MGGANALFNKACSAPFDSIYSRSAAFAEVGSRWGCRKAIKTA
jgi:hypothetical protein